MTLQQLRYAAEIAECRSMNRAAGKFYITQPAMSAAIKELEEELGMSVFIRTNRGVEVTPEGAEFLSSARQLLDSAELIEDRFVRGEKHEKFSVSSQHYTFAVKSFIELTQSVGADRYDLSIFEERTADVINDVRVLRSELGVIYMDDFNRSVLSRRLKEDGLEFSPLFDCHIFVYLSSAHPLADRADVTAGELEPYVCLTFDQGFDSSVYYSEEVHLNSSAAGGRHIRVSDRATMLNMMTGMDGYTLCSGIICEDLNGIGYRAVRLKDVTNEMTIGVIHRKNSVLSALALKYIEVLNTYKERVL